MSKSSEVKLFVFIVCIMLICIILRLMPGIELSNVNDNPNKQIEVEFTRLTIDLKSLGKKALDKIKVINDIVYEKISNKDKKNKEAIVKVIDGNMDKTLKPLSSKLINYEEYEVTEKDTIIPSQLKVKVK